MAVVYTCPRCRGLILVPDEEAREMPPGSIVQHALGQCPTDIKPLGFEYLGTFTVQRFKLDEEGKRTGEPQLLAEVADSMTATKFREIAQRLATKVGDKLTTIIQNADLVDLDLESATVVGGGDEPEGKDEHALDE